VKKFFDRIFLWCIGCFRCNECGKFFPKTRPFCRRCLICRIEQFDHERALRPRKHWIDGEFQSDKYPTTPRGKVPLSVKDVTAQDLLWEYAQRRRSVDPEFSVDLEMALLKAGFYPE